MDKTVKKLIALMVTVIIMVASTVCAFAVEIDDSKPCSLTIVFIDSVSKQASENLKADIYRVADVYFEDGEMKYELLEDFSNVEESSDGIEFALNLYRMVDLKNISGTELYSNSEGYVVLEDCEKGLYLVDSPDGNFDPFVVSVPQYEDGELIYDVQAKPKTELEPEPTTPTDRTDRTDYTDHTDHNGTTKTPDKTGSIYTTRQYSNNDKTLPRTGMVQWPIPILAFFGALFFAIGYIVNEREKQKEKKK